MNVIPPRLNQKLVYLGYEFIEWIGLIGTVLLFCMIRFFNGLPLVAIVAVLLFRRDGEHNFLGDFIRIGRYYLSPRTYTVKGMKTYGQDFAHDRTD